MKLLLTTILLAAFTLSSVAADAPFLKKGDRVRLQPVAPLQDASNNDVTVLELGPENWILVEYSRTFVKPGESGVKSEKGRLWVNLEHVICIKPLE